MSSALTLNCGQLDEEFRRTFTRAGVIIISEDYEPLPGELDAGGHPLYWCKFWGLVPNMGDMAWYKTFPPTSPFAKQPPIPRSSWWHERGHWVFRVWGDRVGPQFNTVILIQAFETRGMTHDQAVAHVSANGWLAMEQFCSMIPEAFFGEWGGYEMPFPDMDPVNYPKSAIAENMRAFYLGYWFWRPTDDQRRSIEPVITMPPVAPPPRPPTPAPVPPPPPAPAPTATLRFCFDSIAARDIPAGAAIVAGYIDGAYAWAEWDWASFPNAVKVRIAVYPATNDGHVLDVEPGDATPDQAIAWVQMRRAAGVDPTVYTGIGEWDAVRDSFRRAGVAEPHYWIAHYDNDPTPIPGAVAKQYANPTFTGHHYDASVVAGRWPGVEVDMTPDEFNKLFDARYSENAEQVNTTKALKDAVKVLNDRLDKLKSI